MNFSEAMVFYRNKRGLTQTKAAAMLGIKPSYLCDIEKGRAGNPKMKLLYAASEIYGVHSDELCRIAKRVPRDIYDKIVEHPQMYKQIRNMEV